MLCSYKKTNPSGSGELSLQHHTHTHVYIQRARVRLQYLVRSVFFVHVQNVNPQSVPLLERPVAQVTGELPVALVHAARVLQVFVSVILVGKHLPAAVTLEALPSIWRTTTTINK